MILTKLSPRSLTGCGVLNLEFDLEIFFGISHQMRNINDQN